MGSFRGALYGGRIHALQKPHRSRKKNRILWTTFKEFTGEVCKQSLRYIIKKHNGIKRNKRDKGIHGCPMGKEETDQQHPPNDEEFAVTA